MLMLPPLALLATPGALTLRRGGQCLRLVRHDDLQPFAGLIWLSWSAMALGWPESWPSVSSYCARALLANLISLTL
ncbi:MAG: hypothetical protein IPL05_10375 [Betaproteobacteria bacterium]|nr:hypothetical protein [Betaproteobacteria bacterium]